MTKKTGNQRTCPQCGKPTDATYRPFCSKRCQQVDLGRWLNESYVIPSDEPAPTNDEEWENR
ncbi:DNA gyrase inhibitor YacG [Sneathiella chinensis]|uniref:DNA gyrase inhibitor YacG n=1 Tax=Sneathiella chinensis TaxID=349750 RepID=A0ABQ5U1L7_9PROT|nr:DNA gyrase inhibitor YacG [Sneathiella chinensis]GLQ05570.1 hypothetical protein GCM10007924_07910 [Sneathiella chinensis]